jgi:solute carrier family 27 fatty acid transporter 1/4
LVVAVTEVVVQVVQYIGEICRYVLVTPPSPADTQHKIRIMTGNGMRPGVWRQFVDRFKVENVVELYGSTEGNVTLCEFPFQWRPWGARARARASV